MRHTRQKPEAGSQNTFVRFLSFGFVVLIFLLCNTAFAQDHRSADRGLSFLLKTQTADGSFGASSNMNERIRITSVSLLAFLSAGHAPDLGKFGSAVRAGTDYLIRAESAVKVSTSTRQAMLFTLNQAAGVDDNSNDQERIGKMMPRFENEMETIPSPDDRAPVSQTMRSLISADQPRESAPPLSYSTLYRVAVLMADLHLDDVSRRIDAILISRQRPDGSWEGDPQTTAFAVLALTAQDRLMAIGN